MDRQAPGKRSMPDRKIAVLLLTPASIVGFGIRSALDAMADIRVVAQVCDLQEMREAMDKATPTLVAADMELAEERPFYFVRDLAARLCGVPLLAILKSPERLLGRHILRGGAAGVITYSASPAELETAIRSISATGEYIVGPLLWSIRPGIMGKGGIGIDALTDREFAIFRLLGDGYMTSDIASALHISPKTVECYKGRMRKRLGADSSRELMRFAVHWAREGGE